MKPLMKPFHRLSSGFETAPPSQQPNKKIKSNRFYLDSNCEAVAKQVVDASVSAGKDCLSWGKFLRQNGMSLFSQCVSVFSSDSFSFGEVPLQ